MARASASIDELAGRLDLEPGERGEVRARMGRLNRDCGCGLGGAFTIASLLAVIAYLAVAASWSFGVVGAAAAFVLACSLAGKAAGLALASARLELLRRRLVRRARSLEGGRHVRVH